jgi:hypothetical protein
VIGIDTDVLGIYHIFKRDERYLATESFMHESEQFNRGVPIFSLLELCGLIATAKRPEEATEIFEEYLTSDSMSILYPEVETRSPQQFWAHQNAELLKRIQRKMRLGDAAILWTIESIPCEVLVTWNVRHYLGRTAVLIQTPDEWMQAQAMPQSRW